MLKNLKKLVKEASRQKKSLKWIKKTNSREIVVCVEKKGNCKIPRSVITQLEEKWKKNKNFLCGTTTLKAKRETREKRVTSDDGQKLTRAFFFSPPWKRRLLQQRANKERNFSITSRHEIVKEKKSEK